ncbi:hypothetical protein [Microbulbifer magnicolonia]|uniref:hypothetical protein n=1 Tax=Microbulbifer magnicolonia TaxID=3109744 RepID=UPI002B409A04|nr:hypothetical protein [Microbulbifer sp. GG15]
MTDHSFSNVVDLFTGEPIETSASRRFIRLSPELDGLEMLYSNSSSGSDLYSLKILCWGLKANGEVVGLVPWLNSIVACPDIRDPLDGRFEGYYDPGIEEIFHEPPIHKIVELETAAEYFEYESSKAEEVLQEIPDTIGTHAVFMDEPRENLTLTEVVSWRLYASGEIHGMLIDHDIVETTPVLPGDLCLYPAQEAKGFRYFFQHHIANKIKSEDPEALAAIAALVTSP